MDSSILERLIIFYKKIGDILRIMNEIKKLDQARAANLRALKARTAKILTICAGLDDSTIVKEFSAEIDAYQQTLVQSEQSLVDEFGVRLEGLLQSRQITLTGQYPNLRAGLFTIKMDVKSWQVTLWYGPEQERLEKGPLDAETVANRIGAQLDTLGSQLNTEQYASILANVYKNVKFKSSGEETVPIIQLLPEMALALQDKAFLKDPNKENYIPYSRADFSFDLFKLKRCNQTDLPILVQLTVAARALTTDKANYLWIPDDLKGNGSTYSHIRIREA